MFVNNRRRRGALATLGALALWLAATASGAGADPLKIEFLPPPMEGTLSLGLYDNAGKLVRVLYREAETSELNAGDDGLVTQWDGKDDNGVACPPGIYRARGVMVGDLEVEGVDFIGNDWVTDDNSPHLRRITALGMSTSGTPFITATLVGQTAPTFYSITLKPSATPGDDPETQLIPETEAPPVKVYKARVPILPPGVKHATFGLNSTVWGIEENVVKQYSAKDKLMRTLPVQPDDPPPVTLTASTTEDKLYVLYENATLQRLRGYDFTGVKPGAEPKILFENDILASDTYEQIASELKFPNESPFVSSPALTIALIPNPLFHNKPGTLQIRVGIDKEGCYLATADGLLLCHISDTKYLRWAAIGQPAGNKEITVFDSDGAAVEEFRVSKIANMMTFDAGVIQWTTPLATPSPTPTATPSPSPAASPASTPSPTATPPTTTSSGSQALP